MESEIFISNKAKQTHEFLESLEIQSGSVQGVTLLENLKNILNLLALLETLNILHSYIQMRDRAKIFIDNNLESVTVRSIDDVILVLDSIAPGQPINNFENILQSSQEKLGIIRTERHVDENIHPTT